MDPGRLFARLYLDEDVSVVVADIVAGHGFDVTTARDEEMLGQTDEAQLAFATQRQRVLVTHNRADFERLTRARFEAGTTHWGVVIAQRRPPRQIARRLTALLDQLTATELRNQVLYI